MQTIIDVMTLPSHFSAPRDSAAVYTVTRLNREVRTLLEAGLPVLWVEGEISNLARPGSGHIYFSLKDQSAQVRCAMFRQKNLALRFRPDNGLKVLARVKVGLYEPRGEYQLVVEHMEPAGEGALRAAFERLKAKLDGEGLFASERKRPLPRFPRRLGVITSPTGAAIRDILNVLARRFPALPVIVYPVPVQGDDAAPSIVRAIEIANQRAECDVLIVGRGGGSLEDLWAFNEESVARAIHASRLPVISAVGHEVDIAISDLAADVRAPTPSAAAELVAPDWQWLAHQVATLQARMNATLGHRLRHCGQRLAAAEKRLTLCDPVRQIRQQNQRLDDLELRLRRAIDQMIVERRHRANHLRTRLQSVTPRHQLLQLATRTERATAGLQRAIDQRLEQTRHRLTVTVRALSAISPLATLERGYAIARRQPDGAIIRAFDQVDPGDHVEIRLAQGALDCEVKHVHEPTPSSS